MVTSYTVLLPGPNSSSCQISYRLAAVLLLAPKHFCIGTVVSAVKAEFVSTKTDGNAGQKRTEDGNATVRRK